MNKLFWKNRRVLMTGHTGFKGAWLSLWLQELGANICGVALLPNTNPNLFTLANIAKNIQSHIADVRDFEIVKKIIHNFKPEIIVHMATQPLVRYSYQNPVDTYATSVMGAVHVLEATKTCDSVKAIVNVTTGKCYENKKWIWGYRENETLGGHDPYSNSKACSELVTSAYRHSIDETIMYVTNWYRAWIQEEDMQAFTLMQIKQYDQPINSMHELSEACTTSAQSLQH